MDARKILNRVRSAESKDRISITIDKDLLKDFKRIIGDRTISAMIEELVREFTDSTKTVDKAESALPPELATALAALNESQLNGLVDFVRNLSGNGRHTASTPLQTSKKTHGRSK